MDYLTSAAPVLRYGDIDALGAEKTGKKATVPESCVTDLQTDLRALGFLPVPPDGLFFAQTRDALVDFQEAANTVNRLARGVARNVDKTFGGVASGVCDAATKAEIRLWKRMGYSAPMDSPPPWIGPETPARVGDIPLAPALNSGGFWPIQTRLKEGREIAYEGVSGKRYGRAGRRFLADRDEGRFHVGVDLFGAHHDLIVACEGGIIVNAYEYYRGTDALFVECDSGVVINYGEIEADSWKEFGLAKGSRVRAGQPIARVGKMNVDSMCHFEMYRKGTTSNLRHYRGKQPPAALLNPTQYLLYLAQHGV